MQAAFSDADVPFKLPQVNALPLNELCILYEKVKSKLCVLYGGDLLRIMLRAMRDSPDIPPCCPLVLLLYVLAGPRQGFLHLQGANLLILGPKAEAESPCVSGTL